MFSIFSSLFQAPNLEEYSAENEDVASIALNLNGDFSIPESPISPQQNSSITPQNSIADVNLDQLSSLHPSPSTDQLQELEKGSLPQENLFPGNWITTYFSYAFNSQEETHLGRLNSRLQKLGLCLYFVSKDGNCQFSALSDQLFRTTELHGFVRKKVASWLQENELFVISNSTNHSPTDQSSSPSSPEVTSATTLKAFLETDRYPSWLDYCEKIRTDGIWGDHLTLVAACEVFQVGIVVVSSVRAPGQQEPFFTVLKPQRATKQGELRYLYLSHLHESHYDSLRVKDPESVPSHHGNNGSSLYKAKM